ncbi:MAG: A/G-specific adenine glycosylase [Chloroflexi bacterium]|nr:A/G-specific adenine glycosylase [Chloroflexota bacterium]
MISTSKISPARARAFAGRVLAWYATHKRDLPWRRDAHDPYRVWISEALLQQTQVTTVIPYYERFLARFPTVASLAAARLDAVLKTWEGAGYYARARNLHRAAREIVTRFHGRVPSTVDELLSLPGIGRYTAGAIASIAYHRDAPVLDGNVVRVLCRYFGIREDPARTETQKELWAIAETLVPHGRAGDFNQGLMDLGATLCAPRQPACPACPLRRGCLARRLGIQQQLPAKHAKKRRPHHQVAVGIIWKGDEILIAQRFARDLLGGLWEFPGGHRERGESLAECVRREVREELGVRVAVGAEFAVVDHGYSHFSITLHAFRCRYVSGNPRALGCAAFKWVRPRNLSRYAFPAANRKIIQRMKAEGRRPRDPQRG